jgi:hypothetical protein
MKIAVQVSGQLRTLNQSYQTLKSQILDRFDCDIFLTTWGNKEKLGWAFDLLQPKAYSINEFTQENLEKFGIARLAKEYNHTTISPQYVYLFVKHQNVLCGMFNRMMCDQVRRESGVEYDIVINTRTDLVYGEPLSEEVVEAAQRYLLIPQGFDWDCGLNDILSIGSPEVITTVCSEFNHYDEYMAEGITNHPENLFRHHVLKNKLPLRRFSYTLYLRNMQVS